MPHLRTYFLKCTFGNIVMSKSSNGDHFKVWYGCYTVIFDLNTEKWFSRSKHIALSIMSGALVLVQYSTGIMIAPMGATCFVRYQTCKKLNYQWRILSVSLLISVIMSNMKVYVPSHIWKGIFRSMICLFRQKNVQLRKLMHWKWFSRAATKPISCRF